METDFRTFFLLVKTITEIRRNPNFKKYSCSGELISRLVETIFFLHFSEALGSESIFFNEIFNSG